MTALPGSRLALNPIQWMATDDGWLDPSKAPETPELLSLVKKAGFDGVMAEVPAGWPVQQYAELVADTGLELAPGYAVCRSDGRDGKEAEVVENAARIARQHAELGLDVVGLGLGMGAAEARLAHPAQGTDPAAERLGAITDLVGRIAAAMVAEGVRPALHPHVGTWVETDSEGRAVLEAVPADQLGFLPDTGHLAWAGVDVHALISDYADRVPFVHVKDCRLSVAQEGRAGDWDYKKIVRAGLWAEPGRGELPLVEILSALGNDFGGWLMVEVDKPDIEDPYESAVASVTWMRATFGGGR
ncbi:inosose dehydratase [Kribbella sp. VKM Ac-2527]|uniref:Inosose dehydratase n=1 Tax=Kribbella caucasensis TaxID=2512215 RepID=A0A4R6J4W3_9ACTN|nr:sugar phosphate isomerase/epimerase [Kribbella sp. VKM Ac-2527]TDO30439.1 inosose dehydratase [Kribbella sp. VKM Ac-2527]